MSCVYITSVKWNVAGCCRLVKKAITKLLKAQSSGCEQQDAWNRSSVYFVKAAEVQSLLRFVSVDVQTCAYVISR